ncbi:Arc family DNA-binding protein [Streptomyces sp. NPDC000410]
MVQLTLRLPDDIHARLTAQAEADRRSLNSEIVHLLEVALSSVETDDESP